MTLSAVCRSYDLVYANSTQGLRGTIKKVVTGGPTLKVTNPALRCQGEGVYTICNVSGSQITVEYISGSISDPTYLSLKISNGDQAVIDIAVGGMSSYYSVNISGPDTFDPVAEFANNRVLCWDNAYSHTSNKSNPHGVTAARIGLGNVNNTSDDNKPISNPQIEYIKRNEKSFSSRLLGYTEWDAYGGSNDVCTALPNTAKIVIKSMDYDYITFSGNDNGIGQDSAVRIANNSGGTITIHLPYIATDTAGVPNQAYKHIILKDGYYVDVSGSRGSNPSIPNYSQTGSGVFDPIADLAARLK